MDRAMATQVEELPDNKVRLTVEVPQADLQHAVEHATSDLARSVKVPGFRKGKVPTQVLEARIGKQKIFSEAVESHIGGWFLNAAANTRIRPVAAPEYDYDLPESGDDQFRFTATVSVQPTPEPADWTKLEVGYAEPEIPPEVVDAELEELRSSVAELAPVEGRSARTGDVVVIDVLSPEGEGQRDLVVELGAGRLLEELSETAFRADAVDSLVRATGVEAAGPLVEARTRELLNALVRSLERRGISPDAYLQLTGQTGDQLVEQIRSEAQLSVGRELVLEAVAEKLGLEVTDAEIEELIREQAEGHGDDVDDAIKQVFESEGAETLRGDLRLRKALDRVAAEVQRVPAEVARARESIWTPDKESSPTDTKLWTPGSKENT